MRILVGCEESAVVRDAFRARGHDAYSCDLQASRGDSAWHITGDVLMAIRKRGPWDMGLFFPPCTYLCGSGARWWPMKLEAQHNAIEFVRHLSDADIFRIMIENPVGILSRQGIFRKPDQIIQPWQFGHCETKATCLWLKNLPLLVPTDILPPPYHARVHRMAPGPNRARDRSVTLTGIASAMADQWG